MGSRGRSAYILSAVMAILFVTVIVALNHYGREKRILGKSYTFGDRPMKSVIVDRPEDAYRLWKKNGYRGRIVVALGTRLNFVQPDEAPVYQQSPFPVIVDDLIRMSEGALQSNNYLLIAVRAGVARMVVSVVPEAVLQEKIAYASSTEGASATAERIDVPYFGTPRMITALPFLRAPDEPVLLYINASFFRYYDPDDVLTRLRRTGISTDLVVLCRSLDDVDVTVAERERLRRFEQLLGGISGKS
jgi:hypothetical protein